MWTIEDWARLARTLPLRRVELDPRYKTFKIFIAERNINYRTAWDAEHAVEQDRMNIALRTMRGDLDPAYGYVIGQGCENILDDEEPALAPGTPGGPEPELQSADLSMFTPAQQRAIKGIVKIIADQGRENGERSA
jgi:hypothetical protein